MRASCERRVLHVLAPIDNFASTQENASPPLSSVNAICLPPEVVAQIVRATPSIFVQCIGRRTLPSPFGGSSPEPCSTEETSLVGQELLDEEKVRGASRTWLARRTLCPLRLLLSISATPPWRTITQALRPTPDEKSTDILYFYTVQLTFHHVVVRPMAGRLRAFARTFCRRFIRRALASSSGARGRGRVAGDRTREA